MTHIDLFSGIGGFSLAFDNIFYETKNTHIFCEIDPFCQAVLRKHWPESHIYSDIRTIVADPVGGGYIHGESEIKSAEPEQQAQRQSPADIHSPFILTGGFPCQPFSQAGRRKGTADDRHLWPEMLRVIRLTKPQWVIAENVRGLLTIGGGVVFEQVCADLENAGYEVQPIVIPAVAVNAPHRRDRVWFVANRKGERIGGSASNERGIQKRNVEQGEQKRSPLRSEGERRVSNDTSNTTNGRCRQPISLGEKERNLGKSGERNEWSKNWLEVATRLCRVDDGLPRRMDRNPRLKALGNAIVPQVAEEIMRAIKIIKS